MVMTVRLTELIVFEVSRANNLKQVLMEYKQELLKLKPRPSELVTTLVTPAFAIMALSLPWPVNKESIPNHMAHLTSFSHEIAHSCIVIARVTIRQNEYDLSFSY